MKVYIAAPWGNKSEAKRAADLFEAAGHTITKKWWEHPEVPGYLVNDEDNAELDEQAEQDMWGVIDAQVFVLLNLGKSEGKAVETGFAIMGKGKLFLVGKRSNLFHYLPYWTIVSSVEEALGQIN